MLQYKIVALFSIKKTKKKTIFNMAYNAVEYCNFLLRLLCDSSDVDTKHLLWTVKRTVDQMHFR